jgi:hypothetical protein
LRKHRGVRIHLCKELDQGHIFHDHALLSAILAVCLMTQAHLCRRGPWLHTYATAAANSSVPTSSSSYIPAR